MKNAFVAALVSSALALAAMGLDYLCRDTHPAPTPVTVNVTAPTQPAPEVTVNITVSAPQEDEEPDWVKKYPYQQYRAKRPVKIRKGMTRQQSELAADFDADMDATIRDLEREIASAPELGR